MSLERAFKRLAVSPPTVCTHCRRAYATSNRPPAPIRQPSSASALAASLQSPQSVPPTNPSNSSSPPSSTALANSLIQTISASAARQKASAASILALQRNLNRKDFELQQHRRWKEGDVYSPHDLSGIEQAKWKKLKHKPRPKYDVLDSLGLDLRTEYKNFSILSEYVTEFGRIKHSKDTGLRPRNQRRMAKAVRRAIGIGLIPSVYRHPELLAEEVARRRG